MYLGPRIDDHDILNRVPAEYRQLLETVNGYVAYHGGLHVRGACRDPDWHSLRAAWLGDDAIHRLFPAVAPHDVPFAQDALGDQFFLRDEVVWKLSSESGGLSTLDMTLLEFDAAVRNNPVEFLQLGPLCQFRAAGGILLPGQLLSIYPPFIFRESADAVTYRAISARDRLGFLAQLARETRDVPDGGNTSPSEPLVQQMCRRRARIGTEAFWLALTLTMIAVPEPPRRKARTPARPRTE